MRFLTRIPRRYLLLPTLVSLLLVTFIGFAALTRLASAVSPADCKGDCDTNYNKMVEQCNGLPEVTRDRCKERAVKQRDKCKEKCDGGQGGDNPGGV